MGNFEKLSVLVIGVIIVMILIVAIYTWTGDPADPETTAANPAAQNTAAVASATTGDGDGWLAWTDPEGPDAPADPLVVPTPGGELDEPQPGPSSDLPVVPDIPETPAVVAERTYTVKPGQTLSHISLEVYGTTKHWPAIAERNGVKPESITIGMKLIIPAIAASTTSGSNKPGTGAMSGHAPDASGSGPSPGGAYTVRSGDTIQKISQSAFGTIERWEDIWLENLERVDDPRFLRVGMTLQIPN